MSYLRGSHSDESDEEQGEVRVPLSVRELLRDADVASFTVDAAQRIRLWDASAERLFGFKAVRVLGHRCCDVICVTEEPALERCPEHRDVAGMAMRGELLRTTTMTFLRSDGILISVEVTVLPMLLGGKTQAIALLHLARRLR